MRWARTSPTSIATNLPSEAWRLIADTGGHVSIAGPIEMQMSHGVPPFQQALDHGIRPSLSVDVETQMPGELFTQMRSAFALQRMLALEKQRRGRTPVPALLTVREVIELATIHGARANQLEPKIGTLTPGRRPTSSCYARIRSTCCRSTMSTARSFLRWTRATSTPYSSPGSAQARRPARRCGRRADRANGRAVARLCRARGRVAADAVRRLSARSLRASSLSTRVASHDLPHPFLELPILRRERQLRERACIRTLPTQILERFGERHVGSQGRKPPEQQRVVTMLGQARRERRGAANLHRP